MSRRPGTPSLLRELNDRAALDLLLASGPLTRSQLGQYTGLSKVTASQLLARLEERGLVKVVGEQGGGRGPNAALYAVEPSSAYIAALDVGPGKISAAVADITGQVVAEVAVDPTESEDPVGFVHGAVMQAVRTAQIDMSRLHGFVIGTPGMVDSRTGDVRFSFDLPEWHEGVLAALRRGLGRPVSIENDVNLAAVVEQAQGAASNLDDFALVWVGRGLGLATVLGGRLHRGLSGGAGEIGYLPVPGASPPEGVSEPRDTAFQSLVGAEAVQQLAREHGLTSASAPACVREAVADGTVGTGFLDELAGRIAVGVASVCTVLDPGLVVLTGEVGRAGGDALAGRVEHELTRICPNPTRVNVTAVAGNPVLRGALLVALDAAREEVFSATAEV